MEDDLFLSMRLLSERFESDRLLCEGIVNSTEFQDSTTVWSREVYKFFIEGKWHIVGEHLNNCGKPPQKIDLRGNPLDCCEFFKQNSPPLQILIRTDCIPSPSLYVSSTTKNLLLSSSTPSIKSIIMSLSPALSTSNPPPSGFMVSSLNYFSSIITPPTSRYRISTTSTSSYHDMPSSIVVAPSSMSPTLVSNSASPTQNRIYKPSSPSDIYIYTLISGLSTIVISLILYVTHRYLWRMFHPQLVPPSIELTTLRSGSSDGSQVVSSSDEEVIYAATSV